MGALKEYDAVVNGQPTTLLLSDADAEARGLSGGRERAAAPSDEGAYGDPMKSGLVDPVEPTDDPAAPVEPAEKSVESPNKARTAENK